MSGFFFYCSINDVLGPVLDRIVVNVKPTETEPSVHRVHACFIIYNKPL